MTTSSTPSPRHMRRVLSTTVSWLSALVLRYMHTTVSSAKPQRSCASLQRTSLKQGSCKERYFLGCILLQGQPWAEKDPKNELQQKDNFASGSGGHPIKVILQTNMSYRGFREGKRFPHMFTPRSVWHTTPNSPWERCGCTGLHKRAMRWDICPQPQAQSSPQTLKHMML